MGPRRARIILALWAMLLGSMAWADRFAYLPAAPMPGSGTSGGVLAVLNLDTGQALSNIELGEAEPSAVAVSGDGRVFVADRSAARVLVLDTLALQVIDTLELPAEAEPSALLVSPDDRWLLVADGTMLWRVDLAATNPVAEAMTVSYSGTALASSPDGRYVLSLDGGLFSGTPGIALLNLGAEQDLPVGTELANRALEAAGGQGLAVAADGRVYLANAQSDQLLVLRIDGASHALSLDKTLALPEQSAPYGVALSGDGRHLLLSLSYNRVPGFSQVSGKVVVYATEDLSERYTLTLENPAAFASYHPQAITAIDGGRFALVKALWGSASGTVVSRLGLRDSPTGPSLEESGNQWGLTGYSVNGTSPFVGPECEDCPGARDHRQVAQATDGAEGGSGFRLALHPLMAALALGVLGWRRIRR